MRTNEIRDAIVEHCTVTSTMTGKRKPYNSEAARTLAIVLVGDKIEQALGDIGPAMKDGAERMSLSTDDVARALSNIGAEFTGVVSAIERAS